VFVASHDIRSTFVKVEAAEICARIVILRELLFADNQEADFSIHHSATKESLGVTTAPKMYCKIGYRYIDALGNRATFTGDNPYTKHDQEK
jgi:hypothetical protein